VAGRGRSFGLHACRVCWPQLRFVHGNSIMHSFFTVFVGRWWPINSHQQHVHVAANAWQGPPAAVWGQASTARPYPAPFRSGMAFLFTATGTDTWICICTYRTWDIPRSVVSLHIQTLS
jgi:hypothetical protein